MATNVFFRNYDNFNEQNLIDDLVIESIKIYGVDVMYIRRSLGAVDEVLNEDDLPLYDEMFQFEAYVKNVDGFEGEGDFLSKFGLQIRDSITFSVANRTFERYVTKEVVELIFFEIENLYGWKTLTPASLWVFKSPYSRSHVFCNTLRGSVVQASPFDVS